MPWVFFAAVGAAFGLAAGGLAGYTFHRPVDVVHARTVTVTKPAKITRRSTSADVLAQFSGLHPTSAGPTTVGGVPLFCVTYAGEAFLNVTCGPGRHGPSS